MQRAKLTVILKPRLNRFRYFGLVAVIAVGLFGVFQYHRAVSFSYSQNSCFRDITILPKIFQSSGEGVYGISPIHTLRVKNYPIISTKSCVVALKSPVENSSKKVALTVFNIPMPNKKFSVQAEEYPKLDTASLSQKVSVRDPLIFTMNKADKVFSYKINQGDKAADCQTFITKVICDVSNLGLKQNQIYTLELSRVFGGEIVEQIARSKIKTVEPVELVKASVANNQTVYDDPKELNLTLNKNLVEADAVLSVVSGDGKTSEVEAEVSVDKTQVKLKLKKPLNRKANYQLVLSDAIAEDKGVLFQPLNIHFSTSGGPKVTSANIGSSSVEPSGSIVLRFDQTLLLGQDVGGIVKMDSGGPVPVSLSVSGNSLIIKPQTNLPICAKFNISLSSGIANQFGIAGDSGWSINSRIRCYTVSSIGASVQGRAITLYKFGSGSNKYVFFGTTHGDERSTKYLMDRWVQEIDSNYDKLPANTTVFIIPNLNPDGFSAGARRNANGVDLNRNFPANDWKKDVTMPGGELVINGGGASPLSEPESQAIANFVTGIGPKLVLTYHSVASIVSGNSVGISDNLAMNYSKISGYRYSAFGEEDTVFHYDTTGAFETWMHDKVGIPTILVELGSSSSSEFHLNRSAMWSVFN